MSKARKPYPDVRERVKEKMKLAAVKDSMSYSF